jgi:hypothetical protein
MTNMMIVYDDLGAEHLSRSAMTSKGHNPFSAGLGHA